MGSKGAWLGCLVLAACALGEPTQRNPGAVTFADDDDDDGRSFVGDESSTTDDAPSDSAPPDDCAGNLGCACSPEGKCYDNLKCTDGLCLDPHDPTDGEDPTDADPTDADPTDPDPTDADPTDPDPTGDDPTTTGGDTDPTGADDPPCEPMAATIVEFEQDGDLDGWTLEGSWARFTEAPQSAGHAAVTFASAVLGSDGNRLAPYDAIGQHVENGAATSPLVVLPTVLEFRSWHYDEGGEPGSDGQFYDRKRVLAREQGGDWQLLLDCDDGGPLSSAAMCERPDRTVTRAADDFDDIAIDLGALAGATGQIRFEYLTMDDIDDWEQGWFIDAVGMSLCE